MNYADGYVFYANGYVHYHGRSFAWIRAGAPPFYTEGCILCGLFHAGRPCPCTRSDTWLWSVDGLEYV